MARILRPECCNGSGAATAAHLAENCEMVLMSGFPLCVSDADDAVGWECCDKERCADIACAVLRSGWLLVSSTGAVRCRSLLLMVDQLGLPVQESCRSQPGGADGWSTKQSLYY